MQKITVSSCAVTAFELSNICDEDRSYSVFMRQIIYTFRVSPM